MRFRRPGIRTRLGAIWRRCSDVPHWLALRRLGRRGSPEYRDYLALQLRRTLSKRDVDPGVGATTLIRRAAESQPNRGSVLCVGCRNTLELGRFRAYGFEDVVGIDLFSSREDIRVMDMHAMTFADDSFDVVYSSHSLEHSHDVDRVVREIVRVARDGAVVAVEVPVRVRASAADGIEFSGVDELVSTFRPFVGEELFAEEQPPGSETNAQGTEIARIVFRLTKHESTSSGDRAE